MTDQDKKEIKEIFEEGFKNGFQESFTEVWERNLKPAFDEVNHRFDKVENRLDKVENHLVNVEVQMVTKSYLDDKIGDLRGDLVVKLRKEDEKLNRLCEILKRKQVLDDADINQLSEFQIFPKPIQ